MEQLEQFWEKDKERILLFNAITYLILVPDAEKITITLDVPNKQKFEVTRKDLENYFNRNSDEFYRDTILLQNEVIKGVINSPKELKSFFQNHKIEVIQ